MTFTRRNFGSAAILLLMAFSVPIGALEEASKHKARPEAMDLPALIARNRDAPATLDLIDGAGGKEHAPDPNDPYVFIEEDLKQSQPKFDVQDAQGIRWRVKLGEEAKAEVAATRLVWAAGYFVDEDYYFDELKVESMPRLHRGQRYVTEDGVVHGARLERKPKEVKKLGAWSWFDNPFVGTRELNGLRVMMALVNNWDLSTINNSIYQVEGQRRYVVSDLGASFGSTGNSFTRSKGNLEDYVRSKFIDKATAEYVDFVMHSRPFLLTAPDVPNYLHRTRMEEVAKQIPRADAKWLGRNLAQLSKDQIGDCFRAAGYSPEEVERYTKAVQERIAELNGL